MEEIHSKNIELYILLNEQLALSVSEPILEYNQQIEYRGTTINGAIKDYYIFSTNREKVLVLKWIVRQPQFVEMKRFTEGENKIFTLNESQYAKILISGEMPKNLQIAHKFVKNKYDVFILSNPSNTKSADFIIRQKDKLFYVEGKTSIGGASFSQRLKEGVSQSDRIVINLIAEMKEKCFRKEIIAAFSQYESLKCIMVFRGSRLFWIDRKIVFTTRFEDFLHKLWMQKK